MAHVTDGSNAALVSHGQPGNGETGRFFLFYHSAIKTVEKSSFPLAVVLKPDARIMAVRREGGDDADVGRRCARELSVTARAEH